MSFPELAGRCQNRWPDIVASLSSDEAMRDAIERGSRQHGFCPVHVGDHGDAFRVHADFADTGGAHCNTCGPLANGFALLRWLNDWTWAEVAIKVEEYLNDGTRAQTKRTMVPISSTKPRVDTAPTFPTVRRLWQQGHLLSSPKAAVLRRYLERRGLADIRPVPATLRVHPKMEYYDYGSKQPCGRYPTLMAPMVGPDGKMVGLMRIYLSADGTIASVKTPKKPLRVRHATLTGAAVRLTDAGPVLGVTEGIETGVAVIVGSGMPVWAATNTALLGSMIVPTAVRHVIIWADNDVEKNGKQAGRVAAEKLAARMVAEQRTVEIRYPTLPGKAQGVDWNDVLLVQGKTGFPPVNWQVPPLPTLHSLMRTTKGRRLPTISAVERRDSLSGSTNSPR